MNLLTTLKSMAGLARLLVLLPFLLIANAALAADNTGTGDIAGNNAALVNSNTFSLLSTGAALALVKTGWLSDGTPLTSGSTLPAGTIVKFMVYVNNNSSVAISDVSMQDILDPLFAFQTGTLKIDSSVANCAVAACNATEQAAIFAAADGTAALTDVVDGDTVSFTGGTTVDAGNANQANGQLDAPANSVTALLFSVQMQ